MEKHKLEAAIKKLSAINTEWNNKYKKLNDTAMGYKPGSDSGQTDTILEELDSIQSQLKEIGGKYREMLKEIVVEMKDDVNDPVISKFCNQVLDDIDYNYGIYHGDREKQLCDINDIIEMYKTARG